MIRIGIGDSILIGRRSLLSTCVSTMFEGKEVYLPDKDIWIPPAALSGIDREEKVRVFGINFALVLVSTVTKMKFWFLMVLNDDSLGGK